MSTCSKKVARNLRAGQNAFILRDPAPGDIGWAVSRQAAFYTDLFGWDGGFERLLLEISADYMENFDPARERGWIAELAGDNAGCIFLVRKRGGEGAGDTAQLRMLYVEPKAQGHGIGRALVDVCVSHAREIGYRRMELWTNAELGAARHLYEQAGFRLESEDRSSKFGKDFHGQQWALEL